MSPTNSDSETSLRNYAIFDDPLYISNSDQPNQQLVTKSFSGDNFLPWKRDVYLALIAKNKEGFVDGTLVKPDKKDNSYHQWIRCDVLVMKWILHSLDPSIRETVSYAGSAKELWNEILERYGQSNALEIYQLRKELNILTQENSSVVEYYSTMKRTWESLDAIDPIPLCTCEAMSACSCHLLKRMVDRDTNNKLIHFMMGLNSGFDGVKTNVLSMEPLPPLNKALALFQKIEKQKHITDATVSMGESTAYAGMQQNNTSHGQQTWKKPKFSASPTQGTKACTFCNHLGHTRDECFKLHACETCGRRGHKTEHCYQRQNQPAATQYKGKALKSYPKKNQPYKRSGANAVDVMEYDDATDASPLDDLETAKDYVTQPDTYVASHFDPSMVTGIVKDVTQQVLAALTAPASQHSRLSAANFAGPFK